MWDNTHFPAHSDQQTDTADYLWLYRRLPVPPGQHRLLRLSCNSSHDPKEAIKPFQKASLRHNPRHWALKSGRVQVQELDFSLHLSFSLCLSRTVSIQNCVSFLEKEMATHSSTPAWRIPWREEPGRLLSMGSQRVGRDWATSLHFIQWCEELKDDQVHGINMGH